MYFLFILHDACIEGLDLLNQLTSAEATLLLLMRSSSLDIIADNVVVTDVSCVGFFVLLLVDEGVSCETVIFLLEVIFVELRTCPLSTFAPLLVVPSFSVKMHV